MSKITVLIVDDHELLRSGLRQLFEQEPDVAEATSANDAMQLLAQFKPDVLLLDLHYLTGTDTNSFAKYEPRVERSNSRHDQ